jgi:hypothetical protein
MTTSQRPPRAGSGSGSPVRRALGRSLRALRDLHEEQVYAWERLLLSYRAPQPYTHTPAPARDGHAAAGSGAPAPVGVGSGDQAA